MSDDWKQRPEGGGWFALWLIRAIGCYGGRSVARALLYPITLYFLLRRPYERAASRRFLDRALGRPATLWDIAKHIHTFASTILDRVFLLSGELDRFDIRTHGLDALHEPLDRGQGVLLFGSHLGSFDAMRVLGTKRPQTKIRVVLDKQHNPSMQALLDALNPELAANIIDAGMDGPSVLLAIKEATDEGALVALLVDRAQPGTPTLDVPFMGGTAAFPTSPWLIAAMLKLPVCLAWGLYRGGNRYELDFRMFSEGLVADRHNRAAVMADCVRRYAVALEDRARQAPYNWFNFFEFWRDDDAATIPVPPAADRPAGADAPRRVA
ncbi:acyltransferase [Lysobacter xinjiangensis]|uniref:Acyltransferase n=1 Tax=Cognatilysobacter xinjiangensis TaxID=546892 RepID=A0ABQ3CAE8_9GAMM|nr:acyltransferase [Lysobacter xinjiangensis]GGZ67591.1 acyltransferase [Lysobacter xinjiangensis]